MTSNGKEAKKISRHKCWQEVEVTELSPFTTIDTSDWSAILVKSGEVQVFLQEVSDSGLGQRHLLLAIRAGQVFLFDGLVPPEGWQIVVTCHAGTTATVLRNVDVSQLFTESDFERINQHLQREISSTPWSQAAYTVGQRTNLPYVMDDLDSSVLCEQAVAVIREWQRSKEEDLSEQPLREQESMRMSLDLLANVGDRAVTLVGPEASDLELLDDVITRISKVTGSTGEVSDTEIRGSNWVADRIEATGVRTRVVKLEDDWWKRSSLSLVGFTKEGQVPVALIPALGAYRLYDPRTSEEKRMTAEQAAELADTAYMVYPTFRPGPITFTSMFKLMKSELKGQMPLVFGLSLVAALISLLVPIMTGLIFNQVLPNKQPVLLVGIAMLLAGAAIAAALVDICNGMASSRLIGRLASVDESAMMSRLMGLPSSFVRQFSTGDLGARVTGLQQIRTKALSIILSSGIAAIMSIVSLVLLFVYSAKLALVALAVLIIVLGIVTWLNVRWVRREQEMLDQSGQIDSAMYEWIRSIPKIQIAGAERRIMMRWSRDFGVQQNLTVSAGRLESCSSSLLAALSGILALALFSYIGYFMLGEISGGSYLAFNSALGQFTGAVLGLTATLGPVIEIVARWKRLQPLFDQEEEKFGNQNPGELTGAIKLTEASFSYDEDSAPVLKNINLDIRPGQFVAIVGPSGCGKSTMLRLILGLDQPGVGSVGYDGVDLNLLDVRQVRSQIGVVMQNARPLPGEIQETILGEPDGDESQAWKAAETAGIADDIRKMPMKMKTLIGEGATAFSGGQIQRLMIAKALASEPRILLFDEATSALDEQTQSQVTENINALNVTRVVVAHRLSTIRQADLIVVLDRGQIVDKGTFDELMSRPGHFQEMASRQMTEGQPSSA